MEPIHERRRHPRITNNIPVKICQDEGDCVTETANISRSGAYCRVNKYIEPMTKLDIHLLIPLAKKSKVATKKITCGGVVVRTEPDSADDIFNIAIFFSDISTKDAEVISDYISAQIEDEEE